MLAYRFHIRLEKYFLSTMFIEKYQFLFVDFFNTNNTRIVKCNIYSTSDEVRELYRQTKYVLETKKTFYILKRPMSGVTVNILSRTLGNG